MFSFKKVKNINGENEEIKKKTKMNPKIKSKAHKETDKWDKYLKGLK